jgi:signal transduction histidine kinase
VDAAHVMDAHDGAEVAQLRARCEELEDANRQLTRINEVLMNRVERDLDVQGSSFSSFQSAIALESKVKERTAALNDALQRLERTNRELTASNTEALQASRAKSAFLATMSHELRTPMNGVVGMTELLLTTPLSPHQRDSAMLIQRSALSLVRIVNDVLDFSKIEAGQMETEHLPFAARDVVEQAVQLLRPQMAQKGIRVQIGWATAIPTLILGDAMRFSQIITNLVANAIKFTAHGEIRVTARVVGGDAAQSLRVDVSDTGIGIAPEVLPRLFASFSQADSSTTRQFGGTGLGLAIVRRLCEIMGGSCGVESSVGVGSTFWFTLPLEAAEETAVAVSTPLMQNQREPAVLAPLPLRVLVAEDNEVNQLVVRGFLTALDCECTVVANGQLAVDALCGDHSFDVVMMDWQMPELDGLEATRLVRAYEAAHGLVRTPIVALTANALGGDRDRCMEAGMDDFLSKPFQLKELQRTLQRWRAVESAV